MARMTTCPECDSGIGPKDVACPKCGRPNKPKTSPLTTFVAGLIVLGLFSSCLLSAAFRPDPGHLPADAPPAVVPAPISNLAPAEVATVPGEGSDDTPPTAPRSEAEYGALYLELRAADGAAAKVADRTYPEVARTGGRPSKIELNEWFGVHYRELDRRYESIAARVGTSADNLRDIREEGDVRGWSVRPEKRDRLYKTEADKLAEIQRRREDLKLAKAARAEAAQTPATAEIAEAEAAREEQVDDARAASLLNVGRNLEKIGKTKGALEAYRDVVSKYAGTPSAKAANERIDALARPKP